MLKAGGKRFLDELPDPERDNYRSLERDLVHTGSGVATPWFRSLLSYDPAATLARVKCPVLALIGEKDVQVPANPNLAALRASLAVRRSDNSSVRSLPSINHMLQTCRTGAISEYIRIDETISAEVLEVLVEWAAPIASREDR